MNVPPDLLAKIDEAITHYPVSKLRIIQACIASAYAEVTRAPKMHTIDPSEPTKLAAISIRPAIRVWFKLIRDRRSAAPMLIPAPMPPASVASTMAGVANVSAS